MKCCLRSLSCCWLLLAFVLGPLLAAQEELLLEQGQVTATVVGEQLRLSLSGVVPAGPAGRRVRLLAGEAVLPALPATTGWRLHYEAETRTWLAEIPGPGAQSVTLAVLAPSRADPAEPLRRLVLLDLPPANSLDLTLEGDLPAMELSLPGTLRTKAGTRDGQPTLAGLLPGGLPGAFAWRDRAPKVVAQALISAEVNALANVSAGAIQLDVLYRFEVRQGQITELRFRLPPGFNLTQVRGEQVRDWQAPGELPEARELLVTLAREQTSGYLLQLVGEWAMAKLPAETALAMPMPLGVTRAEGHLAIGTSAALNLQPRDPVGLSQIDAAAFPRVPLDRETPRTPPGGRTLSYAFPALPASLTLGVSEIMPALTVTERLVLALREDDLLVDLALDVSIREAPIRRLSIRLPVGLQLAAVNTARMADYQVIPPTSPGQPAMLEVEYSQPMSGQVLVSLRLELGRDPFKEEVVIAGLEVPGARHERGFIALVPAPGVLLDEAPTQGLESVHPRGLPMRVPDAQYAWRYREPGWRLTLPVKARPATLRAETFHLLSLGEALAYGSVAFSYHLGGAPVDELRVRVSPGLKQVEFVGLDVARYSNEGEVWTIKLRRKVSGDYTLGATYTQTYDPGTPVLIGALEPLGVDTETAYLAVASHLNLHLAEAQVDPALIPLGVEELPVDYRLLVSAPLLRVYKAARAPHQVSLRVAPYSTGEMPAVLVDVVKAQSLISGDPKGTRESRTLVRFVVKNASAQFLTLTLPPGAQVGAVYRVTAGQGGAEQRQPVTAATKDGLLLLPLVRSENPNEPQTLEFEFTQSHGAAGWAGALSLSLPRPTERVAFAEWTVSQGQDLRVRLVSSGAWTPDLALGTAGLEDLAMRALRELLNRRLPGPWLRGLGGLGLLLLVLGLAMPWRHGRRWLLLGACTALFVWGALLSLTLTFRPAPVRSETLRLQQVLLEPSAPAPTLELQALPVWRAELSTSDTMGLLAGLAVALVLAWRWPRRRAWWVLLAGSLLVTILAQVPPLQSLLVALLAAGLPAWAGIALWRARAQDGDDEPGPAGLGTASLALLLGLVLLGALPTPVQAQDTPVAEAVAAPVTAPVAAGGALQATVTVEADAAELRLAISGERSRVQVLDHWLPPGSILLGVEPASATSWLTRRDTGWQLTLPAGAATAEIRFLLPLLAADAEGWQRLQVPLPAALLSRATWRVPGVALEILSPGALVTARQELGGQTANGQTISETLLPPGVPAALAWRPRGRQLRLEKPVYQVELLGALRADAGLLEGLWQAQFRIAQGELDQLQAVLPVGLAVTRVEGDGLGAWRFDPQARTLEVRLSRPASGEYTLVLLGQMAVGALPWQAKVGMPIFTGASQQRSLLALATAPEVAVRVVKAPRSSNPRDLINPLSAALRRFPAFAALEWTRAWRFVEPGDSLDLAASVVPPDLRVNESASFTVADDRLRYVSDLDLTVTRAGIFTLSLLLPLEYDIDELSGEAVSHWDEERTPTGRLVHLQLAKRLLGNTKLHLALSRNLTALPPELQVPTPRVREVARHTGQLVVSADRGLRVTVLAKEGMGELDVAELGLRDKPALALTLLRPDWTLKLRAEAQVPRLTVEALHVARVSDGLVRHTHYLRYLVQNAGIRSFTVELPAGGIGVQLNGPDIARKQALDAEGRQWRLDLNGKWFDQPYPLEISYETRYTPGPEPVFLEPVKALGVEQQRGFLAVVSSARIALTADNPDPALLSADSRQVPAKFGAGQLSDAAYCFTSANGEYRLALLATRHEKAELFDTRVDSVAIRSLLSRDGASLHQVLVNLRAGGRRHLRVTLPSGVQIMSLQVDRLARAPALETDAQGQASVLIPIPQSPGGEIASELELYYYKPAPAGWRGGRQEWQGPRFDLPLGKVTWEWYLPAGWHYGSFDGTLRHRADSGLQLPPVSFSEDAYRSKVGQQRESDLAKAWNMNEYAQQLSQKGEQEKAAQFFENVKNYSQADRGLYEDAQVHLRHLRQQQALVGLVGRRGELRQDQTPGAASRRLGQNFTQEDAERLQTSLPGEDSDNLSLISRRIIEWQETAASGRAQLTVALPEHGLVVRFDRELVAEPGAELSLSWRAWPIPRGAWRSWAAWLGLLILLFIAYGLWHLLRLRGQALPPAPPQAGPGAGAPPAAAPEATTEPAPVPTSAPATAPVPPTTTEATHSEAKP